LNDKERMRLYKKQNPYHIWAYRSDGSKFVAHFKNRKDAEKWAGNKNIKSRLGKVTTAAQTRKKRSIRHTGYGMATMPRWRF
jgi:hypothetical protein